jgi:hypothetical protein
MVDPLGLCGETMTVSVTMANGGGSNNPTTSFGPMCDETGNRYLFSGVELLNLTPGDRPFRHSVFGWGPWSPIRVFQQWAAKQTPGPLYPPNEDPAKPIGPINSTQEPPEIIPEDPENWVPSNPTTMTGWDKTKFVILKIFQGIDASSSDIIPVLLLNPCGPGVMPQFGTKGTVCPNMD